MYLNGDPERGPVRTTAPQAYAQVNFQAGVGAMIALYARGAHGGEGQHVDVSMQEAMANAMDNTQATWDIRHVNASGPGVYRGSWSQPGAQEGALGGRYLFETADGWLTALAAGGLVGPGRERDDRLAGRDREKRASWPQQEWRTRLSSLMPLTTEAREYVEQTLAAFCRKRKKEELVAQAQARGAGWAPVFGPREIVESKQLAAREYWVRVNHDERRRVIHLSRRAVPAE